MKGFFFLALALMSGFVQAQDTIKPAIKTKDSTKLADVFRLAKLDVHARSLFMSSINDGDLKDDAAWAAGAGIGITTKPFHGLQAGFSSFVTYNLWSTDLIKVDPTTLAPNRYEIGLFDIQNPTAKNNLIRIENLFLRYTLSKTSLTAGRMKLNTPFLNPQDGRMNVTMEEGAWLTFDEFKKISISGGWIWGISPRSTTQWYSVGNSFGIYPVGVTEKGAKSNYYHNISDCAGLAMANVVVKPTEKFRINVWDMLVDNVMNTAMIELTNETSGKLRFYQGLMYIHQDAINNGGNRDQTKTYISKGAQSNAISAQVGVRNKRISSSINYTHITGDGRYLAPREWGRDPFYTFMLREKNDGFGNVHAITNKTQVFFLGGRLKTALGYGYFLVPDVKDYRLNKYGMPSYHQINADVSYSFAKFMKGLELRVIGVYKIDQGNTYSNPKYIYNKVNMANITVMADYRF